jgi:hypothetical protein
MTEAAPERPEWKLALTLTVILRVAYSTAAALFSLFLHPNPELLRTNTFTQDLPPPHGLSYALLGIWQRFDTLWYLHIAAHGYGHPQGTVFYPLYPWLIKILGWVFTPVAAALLVSTVASFFLFWGFFKLCKLDLPERTAFGALLIYALWSASFIFFAGYPESLLIALLVWSIYFARRQRWMAAALCGIFAGLAKAIGGLGMIPLVVLAVRSRSLKSWPVLLAPLGGVAYMAWLRAVGFPPGWVVYSRYWKTDVHFPGKTLDLALQAAYHNPDLLLFLNLAAILLFCALVVIGRLRLEYLLYSIAALWLLLTKASTPLLLSSIRLLLPVFPAFMVLGTIFERPWLARRFPLFCMALTALNLTLMCVFLNWSMVL